MMKTNTYKTISFFLAVIFSPMTLSQITVPGSGSGAIPDNDESGLTLTFNVTGLVNPVESINLDLSINHTWVGDLTATLIAPDGIASIVVFGRAGYRKSQSSGTGTNLNGTYTFHDMAANDLWGTIDGEDSTFDIPPGSYRSSTKGARLSNGPIVSDFGGCTTRLNGAFYGLTPEQANGQWTLIITDVVSQDEGMVTATNLTLNEQTDIDLIFEDSFDGVSYARFAVLPASDVLGSCKKSRFDFTGNGLADYAYVANDKINELRVWLVQENDTTTSGSVDVFSFGSPEQDFPFEGDIDGDGIKDAVLFRRPTNGSNHAFYVKRSSRPNDKVLKFTMGQASGISNLIGDYDGDGVEDFAFFNRPFSAGTTNLLIHDSSTGNIREIGGIEYDPGTFRLIGGYDYTGDGAADFIIRRASSLDAEFIVYDGKTGLVSDTFTFGSISSSGFLVGNYTGSDRADIVIKRTDTNPARWFIRNSDDGIELDFIEFEGFNTNLSGDYDGDGFDDIAVYDQTFSTYFIRPSDSPEDVIELDLEVFGLFPLARTRSH